MSQTDPRQTLAGFDFKPETWTDDAACRGYDPAWWDGETVGPRQDATEAAVRICSSCPVRLDCLDYAMRAETQWGRYGIWGGLSPEQRRELATGAA